MENEPPVAKAPVATLVSGVRASLTGVPLHLAWAAGDRPVADRRLRDRRGRDRPGARSVANDGRIDPQRDPDDPVRDEPRLRDARHGRARQRRGVGDSAAGARLGGRGVGHRRDAELRAGRATARRRRSADVSSTPTGPGSWVRYRFTGAGIAIAGRKGPNRGRAEIRIDGVRVATVNAYSKTLGSRWVLFARAVDPARSHTVEVRVIGTAGHPRFDVDAFLILR